MHPLLGFAGQPLTPFPSAVAAGAAVGTAGGATFARGSRTGDAGCRYFPVEPPLKVNGAEEGPPQTPKSAPAPVVQFPGSGGPAWERSTVALAPLAAAAPPAPEFTWILR